MLVAMAGCTGAGNDVAANVTVQAAGPMCGAPEPGVAWVDAASGHLRVSLGQRPTGGYSLELAPEPVRVTDAGLRVRVREVVPAADAMVPQVLTRPCLELQVTPAGHRRLIVETEAGKTLGALAR